MQLSDCLVRMKPTLTICFADNDQAEFQIMRCFESKVTTENPSDDHTAPVDDREAHIRRVWFDKNTRLVVLGDDRESHDLWLLNQDGSASLVGTLKPDQFEATKKIGLHQHVELHPNQFEWLDTAYVHAAVHCKRVAMRNFLESYSVD